MKISELIEELEHYQRVHGDLVVVLYDYDDGGRCDPEPYLSSAGELWLN